MFNFFKSIFHQLFNYSSYKNSKKLHKLLHNGDYHDAISFVGNNKFIFNKALIEQWIANVYATSNGAPISLQASKFNEYFTNLAEQEDNKKAVVEYLKSFNYSPSILQINTNSIEFRGNGQQNNKVPYSEYNIEKVTRWLIAECTLNQFMYKYPHMIELLNQAFNIDNIYPIPNQKSEVLKLFISVFYKESKNIEERNATKNVSHKKSSPNNYFDFSTDFSNLPPESQAIIADIDNTLKDWDWKTSLGYDSFTEESHQLDKILTYQLEFCIQQYIKMPKELLETMRNHEGLNMAQLLYSNLKDILQNIQEMKKDTLLNNAEKLLFNQTVQKTMLANQRSKE